MVDVLTGLASDSTCTSCASVIANSCTEPSENLTSSDFGRFARAQYSLEYHMPPQTWIFWTFWAPPRSSSTHEPSPPPGSPSTQLVPDFPSISCLGS